MVFSLDSAVLEHRRRCLLLFLPDAHPSTKLPLPNSAAEHGFQIVLPEAVHLEPPWTSAIHCRRGSATEIDGTFSAEDLLEIYAIYPGNETITAFQTDDSASYLDAVSDAEGFSGGDSQSGNPILSLSLTFEETLTLHRVAAELGYPYENGSDLGYPYEDFSEFLLHLPTPEFDSLRLLTLEGETIDRGTFLSLAQEALCYLDDYEAGCAVEAPCGEVGLDCLEGQSCVTFGDDEGVCVTCSDGSLPSTWYADGDGDGFGDESFTEVTCDQPEGYAPESIEGFDCDDTTSTTYPGAEEWCDDADNDCDGAIDEAEDLDGDGVVDEGSALDAPTWYADTDGDTYGDAASPTIDCDQPTGYIADYADCDDTDATIYPTATETTGDEVDSDCDGGEICYTDADDDGYRPDATSTTTSTDVDCTDSGEATSSEPTGDCDDSDALAGGSDVEVFGDGIDNNCGGFTDGGDLNLSDATAKLIGENSGDRAGWSVSGAGDVDGDGNDDIIIGAFNENTGGTGAGVAYLLLGPVSGPRSSFRTGQCQDHGLNLS
jgi:hypothetical protein